MAGPHLLDPPSHPVKRDSLRAAWNRRDYTRAAAIAAAAAAHAQQQRDYSRAQKYAAAAQLAKRYEEVRRELRAGLWGPGVGVPILEPRDPSSSEARCNMLCCPDRPGAPPREVCQDRAQSVVVVASDVSESAGLHSDASDPKGKDDPKDLVAQPVGCCFPGLPGWLGVGKKGR